KGDSDNEPDSGSSLFQEGEDDADAVNENNPTVKTHCFAMSPVRTRASAVIAGLAGRRGEN
ncbi:hypothetical protein Tco_0574702, partial [Tanacetum coccineum]